LSPDCRARASARAPDARRRRRGARAAPGGRYQRVPNVAAL